MSYTIAKRLTVCAVALLALSACTDEKAAPVKPTPTATTTTKVAELKADVKELSRDLSDYMYTERVEFRDAVKKQMTEIDKEMDAIAARMEDSTGETRTIAREKLTVLRAKSASIKADLEKTNEANEPAWEDFKKGMIEAKDDVKEALDDAGNWVVKKTQ